MAARYRKVNIPWETDNTKKDPPQTCSVSGKRMYANEREANSMAAHQMGSMESGQVQLRVYRCMYCEAWHLTSKGKSE
jgi:hypothetical protein